MLFRIIFADFTHKARKPWASMVLRLWEDGKDERIRLTVKFPESDPSKVWMILPSHARSWFPGPGRFYKRISRRRAARLPSLGFFDRPAAIGPPQFTRSRAGGFWKGSGPKLPTSPLLRIAKTPENPSMFFLGRKTTKTRDTFSSIGGSAPCCNIVQNGFFADGSPTVFFFAIYPFPPQNAGPKCVTAPHELREVFLSGTGESTPARRFLANICGSLQAVSKEARTPAPFPFAAGRLDKAARRRPNTEALQQDKSDPERVLLFPPFQPGGGR